MDDSEIARLLSKDELEIMSTYSTGFNREPSFGKSLAIVAVDCMISFVGIDAPITESVKAWPKSAGAVAWKAVRNTARIIEAARKANIPIYYTIPQPHKASSGFGSKTYRSKDPLPQTTVVEDLSPREGDRVVNKYYPSGFFGTNMTSLLIKDGIDTLIVTGGTTSGCVRATVVDGASYHYHVLVVEDAVFDRIQISNKVNLLDMRMKYADIISTYEVVKYINALDQMQAERIKA